MSGCSFGTDHTSNLFVAVVRRAQDIALAMCFNVKEVCSLLSMALTPSKSLWILIHTYEIGSVIFIMWSHQVTVVLSPPGGRAASSSWDHQDIFSSCGVTHDTWRISVPNIATHDTTMWMHLNWCYFCCILCTRLIAGVPRTFCETYKVCPAAFCGILGASCKTFIHLINSKWTVSFPPSCVHKSWKGLEEIKHDIKLCLH